MKHTCLSLALAALGFAVVLDLIWRRLPDGATASRVLAVGGGVLEVPFALRGPTRQPEFQIAWGTLAGAAVGTAVLPGIGTVLDDNPRLDVRSVPVARQPVRVVLDARWQTPPDARLLDAPGEAWIMGLAPEDSSSAQARQALSARAQVLDTPADPTGQRIDLGAALTELARRGVNEVHLEAGARLNASALAGLHKPVGPQRCDCLAHDGSRHAMGFRQLGFARQLAARWKLAGTDCFPERIAKSLHQGARARFIPCLQCHPYFPVFETPRLQIFHACACFGQPVAPKVYDIDRVRATCMISSQITSGRNAA